MIKAVLTIDDIATKQTPALVDYLVEKGITVLMFAWGEHIEQYAEHAVYALRHGMVIGNHSYTHPNFAEISFEEGIREIEKTEALLDEIYRKAGVERRYRPFRFPYGSKGGENKEKYERYFKDKGFSKLDDREITFPWWKENGLDQDIDTLWTFDFEEYLIRPDSGFTMENVLKKVHDGAPGGGGALLEDGTSHIILMHDHEETLAMVPGYYRIMIDHVIENGVSFVPPRFFGPWGRS